LSDDPFLTFAHSSVKEYLLSRRILGGPAAEYAIETIRGNQKIAEICLTYFLNLPCCSESEGIGGITDEYRLIPYCVRYWNRHFECSESDGEVGISTVKLALKLYTNKTLGPTWKLLFRLFDIEFDAGFDSIGSQVRYLFFEEALAMINSILEAHKGLVDIEDVKKVWMQEAFSLFCLDKVSSPASFLYPRGQMKRRIQKCPEIVRLFASNGTDVSELDNYSCFLWKIMTAGEVKGLEKLMSLIFQNGRLNIETFDKAVDNIRAYLLDRLHLLKRLKRAADETLGPPVPLEMEFRDCSLHSKQGITIPPGRSVSKITGVDMSHDFVGTPSIQIHNSSGMPISAKRVTFSAE
jgi:hypothetical protein